MTKDLLNSEPIAEVLLGLEKMLLDSNIRKSPETLSSILSDDFIEFGSSGKIYNKAQTIQTLLNSTSGNQVSIIEFNTLCLSEDVTLVTYRAVNTSVPENESSTSYSLRSSIWKLKNSRWQIVFHQGTPLTLI